jgi:HlyD family secretion protein
MAGWWRALRGWVFLLGILGGGYALLHFVVLAPDPLPVRVAVVEHGVVERVVTNTRAGSVRARREATLAAEVGGRIVALPLREGDAVAAGDVVVRLDDAAAQARRAVVERERVAAEAAAAQARIAVDEARREFGRLEALRREGAVAMELVDRAATVRDAAEAAATTAQARVASAAAAVAEADVRCGQHTVRAPFAGRVAERHAELGEQVAPGQPLLRLLDPTEVYVRAEIDEIDLPALAPGLVARVLLDPWRGVALPGRVSRVAPHVSERLEESRTIAIEVELAAPPPGVALLPGISADVEVVLEQTGADALRVPTAAILEGDRVLTVADGVARARPFTAGLRNWEWTEVRAGLAAGEPVIVSLDRAEVRDGARVAPEPAPEAAR